jgi:uncharacterized protein
MTSASVTNPFLPLSEEEIEALDDFLTSGAMSFETMSIDELDGYLTAIVIGPTTLNFSQWFPGIWGADGAPDFDSVEEAQHIIGLIVRLMNGIVAEFNDDPDDIAPIFVTSAYPGDSREHTDASMWTYGFLQGIELCRDDWQPFFDDPTGRKMFRPIYLLGSDDVTFEEEALTETPEQSETLAQQVVDSLAWIYRFWLPYRQAALKSAVASSVQQRGFKIGRNDPCPCGSGKKFKKCCGDVSKTLH